MAIERVPLAQLPTPVRACRVSPARAGRTLYVKMDNLTSAAYGGNKVRKLEYILPRAKRRRCRRIATFGTAGSHHALATAIFARELGYLCTCFLSPQRNTPETADILAAHVAVGTRLVPFVGTYGERLEVLRRQLWGEAALVVAPGGSSWHGTYGFVQAARELAAQVEAGELPEPERLYVATGTMGSAAGLALGMALAGLATELHAVRVSPSWLCNEQSLRRTMEKACGMLRHYDPSIPGDLPNRSNIRLRHEFFAGGYAHTDAVTDHAIDVAREELGLALEATYTGKAMAALLADLSGRDTGKRHWLFWNTYSSAPLPGHGGAAVDPATLPAAFRRYFS